MTNSPYIYFEDQSTGAHRLYEAPREIITVYRPEEIEAAFQNLERAHADGHYLAGYFSYELGLLLEPKLAGLWKEGGAPLLQFGVFDNCQKTAPRGIGSGQLGQLVPLWSQAQYKQRFDKVMSYIRAGDVYQINLTFPLQGIYEGSARAVYEGLKSRQPVRYGGVVDLGGTALVTLSPELFFEKTGSNISMRPMKGTIKRGTGEIEDKAFADSLQADEKNRAENLMIVDLLRNDLSRIAAPGSVEVTDLFTIETYPSLHTMTSGITAKMGAVKFEDIVRALFPCGSVTGAPKIRAMEIINELEARPRGAYCGAVGFVDPGGDMVFNVAIRTLSLYADGTCSYGIGGGVVADSGAVSEYEECLLKAKFLDDGLGLIETIGWDEVIGFMHMDLHLARLKKSAKELGLVCAAGEIKQALMRAVAALAGPHKVRLELSAGGDISIGAKPLKLRAYSETIPIAMSKNALDSGNALLAHKTTRRGFIEGELTRISKTTDCKEVLLFNERGELCEGSYTNVFVAIGGQMFTPPLSSGLLPGILRYVLLENGDAQERALTLDDVRVADEIYVGNSVRGLMKARLMSSELI